MSIEQFAKAISVEEKIPIEEAENAIGTFVNSILKTLSIGEQVEFLGPSNPHPDKTSRYFIKKLSDDKLLFGRC